MRRLVGKTSRGGAQSSPLLIPRTLHALIAAQVGVRLGGDPLWGQGKNRDAWYLLSAKCHVDPLRRSNEQSSRRELDRFWAMVNHHTVQPGWILLFVVDQTAAMGETILMIGTHSCRFRNCRGRCQAYNIGQDTKKTSCRCATIQDLPTSWLFFDVLLANDCLPSITCSKCLREEWIADCKSCLKACPCYCRRCVTKIGYSLFRKRLLIHHCLLETPTVSFLNHSSNMVWRIVTRSTPTWVDWWNRFVGMGVQVLAAGMLLTFEYSLSGWSSGRRTMLWFQAPSRRISFLAYVYWFTAGCMRTWISCSSRRSSICRTRHLALWYPLVRVSGNAFLCLSFGVLCVCKICVAIDNISHEIIFLFNDSLLLCRSEECAYGMVL
jgi:hypothetical protein